jgi:hypothetical protein
LVQILAIENEHDNEHDQERSVADGPSIPLEAVEHGVPSAPPIVLVLVVVLVIEL